VCGLVAIYSRRDPIPLPVLERATQRLRHRGPDGQRYWIAPDRRVALGHARLSIIDLTTGDQPIASEDERTRIVVNGEFYGYEAIQRELTGCAPDPTVRSRSTSMKISVRSACTGCAASSPSSSGTNGSARCSPHATVSASNHSSTPAIGTRSTSHPR